MTRYSFKVGEFFMLKNKTYQIERVFNGSIHALAINDGSTSVYTVRDLLAEYAAAELKFLSKEELATMDHKSPSAPLVERALSNFPPDVQRNPGWSLQTPPLVVG